MSKEVIEAVAKKDADFIEKFVRKILKLAEDHWAQQTEEAHAAGQHEAYNASFNEWHRIRQDSVLFETEIVAKIDRSDAKPEEDEKILPDAVTSTTRQWRKVMKEKAAAKLLASSGSV